LAAVQEELVQCDLANVSHSDLQVPHVDDSDADELREYRLRVDSIKVDSEDQDKNKDHKFLGRSCDYSMYKTFWGVQSFFSSEAKTMESAEAWSGLQQALDQVFGLLLSHGDESVKRESNSSPTTYFGCKYLTSAKLIGLQVRDPLLRQQIACQTLFYTHYLR
jgi:THO complex subunit 1 transcription elongation factor